ncbi:MAG TPA: hypothetical protein P5150_08760 [Candidatus Ratteibacteria bacterium]|nr:hypothetical protein [Candidatus Ratteibacteria bacterium]
MKAMVEIEKIVDLLNSLDKKTKQEILEKMLISYDESPLSLEEKKLIKEANDDYKKGNVIRCKIGK